MAQASGRLGGLAARVLLLASLSLASAAYQPAAAPASSGGLIVIPSPASGPAISYFKLSLERGRGARAGTIGLRNSSPRALRVVLSAVDGLTLDTLGSTYAPSGTRAHGATRWVWVANGPSGCPPALSGTCLWSCSCRAARAPATTSPA
jgi:hypothetical protein